jgi:hypothetical protein
MTRTAGVMQAAPGQGWGTLAPNFMTEITT